jgi:hypothetical protein
VHGVVPSFLVHPLPPHAVLAYNSHNYADDLVILCRRGSAENALHREGLLADASMVRVKLSELQLRRPRFGVREHLARVSRMVPPPPLGTRRRHLARLRRFDPPFEDFHRASD